MLEYVSRKHLKLLLKEMKGSIFFPLKVAPIRIENNFKGRLVGKKCQN